MLSHVVTLQTNQCKMNSMNHPLSMRYATDFLVHVIHNIPSTPSIIKSLACQLTFLSLSAHVSSPTRSAHCRMFLISLAILCLKSTEVVRRADESSRSSESERVERFVEPMRVANGRLVLDGELEGEESQIPRVSTETLISCSRSTSSPKAWETTHLWRDTSIQVASTRSARSLSLIHI